jgi:hypothetical protein
MQTGNVPYNDQKGGITKICQAILSNVKPKLPAGDPFLNVYQRCIEFDETARPTMLEVAKHLNQIGDSIPGVDLALWHDYRDRLIQFDESPYELSDSGTIEKLVKISAKRPIALYQLGCLYQLSSGPDQSSAKAVEYFSEGVKQGCPQAVITYWELIDAGELPKPSKADWDALTTLYEQCTEE